MAAKRKFDDYSGSSYDEQQQRQLYASRLQHCRYHDNFYPNTELVPTQDPSTCDVKLSPTVSIDTLCSPLAPFQIRILKIESGGSDQPLRGLLFSVDLLLEGGVVDPTTRDHHTYEAVSHSWGDQEPGGIMYCNNEIVALRRSQYVMLKHLRSTCNPRYIWLDTICINQSDMLERAAQVKKMFTIFKHAQRVLIWLGLPKSRTLQVFNVINQMEATDLLFTGSLGSNYRNVTRFIPEMCSDCHSKLALGIAEFATFSWFHRTWVRQEVFASRAAVLLCGSFELSWASFATHVCGLEDVLVRGEDTGGLDLLTRQLKLLYRHDSKPRLNDMDVRTGSLSFVYELFDQLLSQHNRDTTDLFYVLATSGSFEASDPRDIIYAVLGMTSTQTSDRTDGRPSLRIDYSCDATQVFRKTTEYFIQREQCLDAMFLAQFNRDPLGKLVSWCPYWPIMNCETHKLRQLCHVGLLDRHRHRVLPAFDGENWPRVINTEDIDVQHSAQPRDFCSFSGDGLQIEGHALGIIKAIEKDHEARKLALTSVTNRFSRPGKTTTIISNCEAPSKACNDYEPLQVEHMAAKLSAFIQQVRDGANDTEGKARWSQEEIDRFCVASVPTSTKDGDLFCFLRASTALVILRPLQIARDVCRVHFVGIAFASQGIFEKAKFVRPDAYDWLVGLNQTGERARADIRAFNHIVRGSSDVGVDKARDQSPDYWDSTPTSSSTSSPVASAETCEKSTEKLASKPRVQMPVTDVETAKPVVSRAFNDHLKPAYPRYQRHYDGPIYSLRMTFDIV